MGVTYIIAHEPREVLNTDFFVEQLRKKWPEVEIHYFSDSDNRSSLLQFTIPNDFWVLGDFTGTGISYKAIGRSNIAQFALWYRSVVPAEWQLRYYDSGLYFDIMLLTSETTEEQIIAGFGISWKPKESNEFQ